MPASSDGGQGLQNQGGNHQNVNLYDQTQRLRGHVGLSTPIQEGFQGGQATINDDTESDAGSLLFNNSEFAGIQATPSFQQPALSENTGGHSLPSTSPVQSASGFSGVSMNIPSGGHLRRLPSYNEESVVIGINVDLQILKRKLKQKIGDTYETIVANCVSTFNDTTLNEADISKCSSQLLYYVGDNALKCQNCKQTGNIGTIFRHEERCIVGICSQRDQDVRHSNLPNSTEGDVNIPVLPFNRRQEGELQDRAASGQTYGATGGYLQAGGPPSPLLSLNRRQEGELQDRAARGQTYGATGGVSQAGGPPSEEKSYKADNFQTCSESGYTTALGPPTNQTAQNVHLTPGGSTNGRDQNRNQGPCLPPSLPNSTEGHVNVQMKLLSLDRRQEGGLQDRGPTDGATGGALQEGALLSEETSFKAAILPNEDTRKLLLEMGFKEDKIHRAQQIFNNRKSNMEWTVADFLDILDNEIHQENVMDPSICGVCHERKAAASQFECRHVVCLDCAPKRYADRCKICNRPVVRVVAIDL